ncbi:MAG: VOC family protein [Burkholderiales bacterium]|nr:VOC family protein [Opitutaceae bacterium]
MIRKLAHLCLITNDLDRLVAFYRDALGLTVKFRFAAADGAIFGAYVEVGDSTFIEFFDQHLSAKQWGGNLDPLSAGNRYGHLCLEVTGLADFRATLVARGVSVGEIRTGMDSSLQAWLADPDGNRIELMEYTHRSAQLAPGGEKILRSAK